MPTPAPNSRTRLFLNNDISLEEKFKLGKVKDISTYPHYNLLYNNINI
jgi:hypothetical protein